MSKLIGIYLTSLSSFDLGCGNSLEDYKWFSSNVAVVSVSTFGSIQAKRPGQAIIRVVSVFDSANYDEVPIYFS